MFGIQAPSVSYAGAGSAAGGAASTTGTDWGAIIGGALGAGMQIWDAHTYTEQERARDELLAQQAAAQQAAAQATAAQRSGLLTSPAVLIAGGGVLLLGVVLLARK